MNLSVNGYTITLTDAYGHESKDINAYDLSCRFNIKTKLYNTTIIINKWPTGNCQLSSIGYADNLLKNTQNNKEDIHAVLKECYRLCNGNVQNPFIPHLAIVDVKSEHILSVEKCFDVVVKNPYKSTNGSAMCLFIVKLDYNY